MEHKNFLNLIVLLCTLTASIHSAQLTVLPNQATEQTLDNYCTDVERIFRSNPLYQRSFPEQNPLFWDAQTKQQRFPSLTDLAAYVMVWQKLKHLPPVEDCIKEALKRVAPVQQNIVQTIVEKGKSAYGDLKFLHQDVLSGVMTFPHTKRKGETCKLFPLNFAIKKNNKNLVRALVQAGADVNAAASCSSFHPLMHSFRMPEGRNDMLKLLCELGADQNYIDSNGISLLVRAFNFSSTRKSKSEEFDIAQSRFKMLLSMGADVDYKNSDGETALIFALSTGNYTGVKLLMLAGATLQLGDVYPKETPREFAQKRLTRLLDSAEGLSEECTSSHVAFFKWAIDFLEQEERNSTSYPVWSVIQKKLYKWF